MTGPEWFWARRNRRAAFAVTLVLSSAIHLLPWVRLGFPSSLDVKDVDGEAALPIDVLIADEAPPAPPPEEAPPAEPSPPAEEPAAAPKPSRSDGGLARDGAADASPVDDAGPADAMADGAVAAADSGALEPSDIASAVQGGPTAIEIAINAEVVRKHPVGAKMALLLRGIPQWDDFMHGTSIDPVRDVDWILISGNSLIHTENDSVVLHYSTTDAAVDKAVAIVTRKYGRGSGIDAGVPGVQANLAFADRAERVLLRPGSHLLAIVPPKVAPAIARQLAGRRVSPPLRPGEALFWRFVGPHRMLGELPESIVEMRLRVVPHADGSADVDAEGDTASSEAAQAAAKDVARFVRRHDDAITSLLTRGILDHVEVTAEGKVVRAHLTATLDQIDNLVSLVSGFIDADQGPAPGPASASPPPGPNGAPRAPAPGGSPRLR